jgi:cysteine synthase
MMLSGIRTLYPEDGVPSTSFDVAHPVWRPHLFQGWATDFIPKLVDTMEKEKLVDEIKPVSGFDAMKTAQELATKEGIFCGTSGGGIVATALEIATDAPKGTNILAIVTDTAERYMSTPLFGSIPADMTPEEKELADSTPSTPPARPSFRRCCLKQKHLS